MKKTPNWERHLEEQRRQRRALEKFVRVLMLTTSLLMLSAAAAIWVNL